MKLIKKQKKLCIQACINTYNGEHGNVDLGTFAGFEEFKKGHVEGISGKIGSDFYIVFRGSDGTADWKDNFKVCKRSVPFRGTNDEVEIHEGHAEQYKSIMAIIRSMAKNSKCKNIIVTGHSLGGSLASICAVDLSYNLKDKDITCITFGSPRVGNNEWVKSFKKRIKDSYRYVYGCDTVCGVPLWVMGYRHVPKEIKLGKRRWYNMLLFPVTMTLGNPADHRPECYKAGLK